jgi:hypothetical protein
MAVGGICGDIAAGAGPARGGQNFRMARFQQLPGTKAAALAMPAHPLDDPLRYFAKKSCVISLGPQLTPCQKIDSPSASCLSARPGSLLHRRRRIAGPALVSLRLVITSPTHDFDHRHDAGPRGPRCEAATNVYGGVMVELTDGRQNSSKSAILKTELSSSFWRGSIRLRKSARDALQLPAWQRSQQGCAAFDRPNN